MESLASILKRVVKTSPAMRDPASRGVVERVINDEDNRRDSGLVIPSKLYPGENANCPRCQDLGWLNRQVDGRWEPVPCPDCRGPEIEKYHRKRLAAAGIPDARIEKTLASFRLEGISASVERAYNAAKRFVEERVTPWLCLTGPKGCGKTHLAYAVAIEESNAGREVRFYSEGVLANLFHAVMGSEEETVGSLWKKLASLQCLVVDELGQNPIGDWAMAQLESLLGARYEAEARTVLVANLKPEDVETWSGRIYSRLKDRTVCEWVDMVGAQDYRPRLTR